MMTAEKKLFFLVSFHLLDPEGASTRVLLLECLRGKATEGGNGRNPSVLNV